MGEFGIIKVFCINYLEYSSLLIFKGYSFF